MFRVPRDLGEASEMAGKVDNTIAGAGYGFIDGYHGDPPRETWTLSAAYETGYRAGVAAKPDAARAAKP